MQRKERVVLAVCLIVTIAAAAMLGMEHVVPSLGNQAFPVFQKSVGGLGLGAIAAPSGNLINYDPRIMPVDDSFTWPMPGGYSFGPDRSATVCRFAESLGPEWHKKSSDQRSFNRPGSP